MHSGRKEGSRTGRTSASEVGIHMGLKERASNQCSLLVHSSVADRVGSQLSGKLSSSKKLVGDCQMGSEPQRTDLDPPVALC